MIIPDPVYPVYVDTNIMAGRKIQFVNGSADNHFLPLPDEKTEGDIVYICSPNNPTGAVYTKEQLKIWVDWALERQAVILFDSAYEVFIRRKLAHKHLPIPGRKNAPLNFVLFQDRGLYRNTLRLYGCTSRACKENVALNKLWLRRQTTKFNGVPYIVQRGAR